MCIGCLEKLAREIEKALENNEKDSCPCPDCIDRKRNQMRRTNLNDLKVIILTKIKKRGQACIRGWAKLDRFEAMMKTGLKNKLDKYLEDTDDHKETLCSGVYLETMNDLKKVYNNLETIEKADADA